MKGERMQPVFATITPYGHSTTVQRPAPTRAPLRMASVGKDRVFFGADPLSDVEKLAKTRQEAHALFSQHQTRASLIAALPSVFGDGLAVFDGNQPGNEWVNEVCKAYGNAGFFQPPDSLLYGEDPARPVEFADEQGKFPDVYTKTILPELYAQQKPAIYIAKDADTSILMHEVFHALQFKNGLAFSTTPEADEIAKQFRNRFNAPISAIPWLDRYVLQPVKLLCHWMVSVPMTLLGQALQKTRQPESTSPPTPGEALRVEMAREKEVDKFLICYGNDFGLSLWDRFKHLEHYLFQSMLLHLLSRKLDGLSSLS